MKDKTVVKSGTPKDMQNMTHFNPHDSELCLLFTIHMQKSLCSVRWPDDTFYKIYELLENNQCYWEMVKAKH